MGVTRSSKHAGGRTQQAAAWAPHGPVTAGAESRAPVVTWVSASLPWSVDSRQPPLSL